MTHNSCIYHPRNDGRFGAYEPNYMYQRQLYGNHTHRQISCMHAYAWDYECGMRMYVWDAMRSRGYISTYKKCRRSPGGAHDGHRHRHSAIVDGGSTPKLTSAGACHDVLTYQTSCHGNNMDRCPLIRGHGWMNKDVWPWIDLWPRIHDHGLMMTNDHRSTDDHGLIDINGCMDE